jgi:hypothetical protein
MHQFQNLLFAHPHDGLFGIFVETFPLILLPLAWLFLNYVGGFHFYFRVLKNMCPDVFSLILFCRHV